MHTHESNNILFHVSHSVMPARATFKITPPEIVTAKVSHWVGGTSQSNAVETRQHTLAVGAWLEAYGFVNVPRSGNELRYTLTKGGVRIDVYWWLFIGVAKSRRTMKILVDGKTATLNTLARMLA
jgi:hypothetical protein